MKSKAIFLLVLLATMKQYCVFGQVSIDAEFRPRTEYRQGFRKPLADTLQQGFVTLQRTRLSVDYKSKVLNARISLQDARIWGNSDTKTNASKIEINEAWFEYLVTSGLSFQAGRQALNYDDKRLFSSPVWSNTGTSHDALLIKYRSPAIQIHMGAAYNNTKDTLSDYQYGYTPKQNYKTLNYIWLSRELYKGLNLSAIGVIDGFQKKTNAQIVYGRYTYGGNLVFDRDSSKIGFSVTAYKQSGIDPNKAYGNSYAKLNAYLLAGKITYKANKYLVSSVGMDYYSGSATDIETSKSNTFNRLYGAPHSFNGYMEYFQTLPTQGLIDYYLNINSQISSRFSSEIALHSFSFDKDFLYKKVKVEKNLGTELDITLKYNVSKEISFQGGYSYYFNSGSTTKYYKMYGVDIHASQWAYVMLTVKPNFYKTPAETK
jgi:hypothetical protein